MLFFPTGISKKILNCVLALGSNVGGGGGDSSGNIGWVDGLYRYPCKGLSADTLKRVTLLQPGDTFPDNRVYALLKIDDQITKNAEGRNLSSYVQDVKFDAENPQWIHKENFLCAFTAPKFLAQFESKYDHHTKRLSLIRRSSWLAIDDDDNINKRKTPSRLLAVSSWKTHLLLFGRPQRDSH
jgi:hypothetical protein